MFTLDHAAKWKLVFFSLFFSFSFIVFQIGFLNSGNVFYFFMAFDVFCHFMMIHVQKTIFVRLKLFSSFVQTPANGW